LTSKVTKVLDISSKNGWISNIRLCLWLFSLFMQFFYDELLSWDLSKNLVVCG
jgi:hypothetical protein